MASERFSRSAVLKLSMKSKKTAERNLKGCVGSRGATGDPPATELWGSCEEFLSLVLVPLLDCLKKKLCSASPELKREILGEVNLKRGLECSDHPFDWPMRTAAGVYGLFSCQ